MTPGELCFEKDKNVTFFQFLLMWPQNGKLWRAMQISHFLFFAICIACTCGLIQVSKLSLYFMITVPLHFDSTKRWICRAIRLVMFAISNQSLVQHDSTLPTIHFFTKKGKEFNTTMEGNRVLSFTALSCRGHRYQERNNYFI